jgi:hypothetical protein
VVKSIVRSQKYINKEYRFVKLNCRNRQRAEVEDLCDCPITGDDRKGDAHASAAYECEQHEADHWQAQSVINTDEQRKLPIDHTCCLKYTISFLLNSDHRRTVSSIEFS